MSTIGQYFRERFPLQSVLPLSLITALYLVGVATPGRAEKDGVIAVALTGVTFVAFLLRQRATDEFKDRVHDSVHYPDRPVPRGLVTSTTVVRIGVVAFAVEITGVIALAVSVGRPTSALAYAWVLGFSALTVVEFFVPRWLDRHFTTYFLTHQLIFVCFLAWMFATFDTPVTGETLAGSLAFLIAMSAVEIVRKFEVRLDANGNPVPDTYPTVWGRRNTVAILAVMVVAGATLLFLALGTVVPLGVALLTSVTLLIFHRSDNAVRGSVLVSFLAQGVGAWTA